MAVELLVDISATRAAFRRETLETTPSGLYWARLPSPQHTWQTGMYWPEWETADQYSVEFEEVEVERVTLRQGGTEEEAEVEILEFVSAHPRSDAMDIADGLLLPLDFVNRITARLIADGTLREGE